jgi:hypothetical protein
LGEPSIFEPAKIAAAAIRRTAELRRRQYFLCASSLGQRNYIGASSIEFHLRARPC